MNSERYINRSMSIISSDWFCPSWRSVRILKFELDSNFKSYIWYFIFYVQVLAFAGVWAKVLCSHRRSSRQEGCGGSRIVRFWDGSCGSGMDRAVFLDWISSAPIAYLTISLWNIWFSLDIWDICRFIVRGINRVGRYIWSKYILTDVIG